jgi:hypothetical protein
MELLSVDDACAEALRTARELVSDAVKAGSDLFFDAVVIADERGDEVTSVRVADVLPKRLR